MPVSAGSIGAVAHQNGIRSNLSQSVSRKRCRQAKLSTWQATQVVEQVYTEIDGPDDGTPVPSANFFDLTLIGIQGRHVSTAPNALALITSCNCIVLSEHGVQVRLQMQGLAARPV